MVHLIVFTNTWLFTNIFNLDLNTYLSLETFGWCQKALKDHGYDCTQVIAATAFTEMKTTSLPIYRYLKRAIRDHVVADEAPKLSFMYKTLSRSKWQTSIEEIQRFQGYDGVDGIDLNDNFEDSETL